MLLLWYASLLVSILTFIFGMIKRSWMLMLLSMLTFLPISYYFYGSNNGWKFVALTPIIMLLLTIVFWRLDHRAKTE